MDLHLAGRTALVTGGATGVGREIALALAAEGAAVGVNYRRSAVEAEAVVAEIAANGGKAIALDGDVTDLAAVQAMVARVAEAFGGLDILVNNAGLAIRQRFNDTTPDDWRRQIDTCLYGAIHCCHAAAPYLEKSGAGRIVSLIGNSSRVGEIRAVDRRGGARRGDRPRQIARQGIRPLRHDRQCRLARPDRNRP